jgi:hypothetical protein
MSEAKSGIARPAFRCAHAGYNAARHDIAANHRYDT